LATLLADRGAAGLLCQPSAFPTILFSLGYSSVDCADCSDAQPGAIGHGQVQPRGQGVGAPATRTGEHRCDHLLKIVVAHPWRPDRAPPDNARARLTGAVREVVKHDPKIVAAGVVIWQFVAVAIAEHALNLSAADRGEVHRGRALPFAAPIAEPADGHQSFFASVPSAPHCEHRKRNPDRNAMSSMIAAHGQFVQLTVTLRPAAAAFDGGRRCGLLDLEGAANGMSAPRTSSMP
jgi:hypothetical protein